MLSTTITIKEIFFHNNKETPAEGMDSCQREQPQSIFAIIALSIFYLAAPHQIASAQVPTCDALTMYGNAANEGLCKTLSPGTQVHWICELTTDNPDIHTTFNAGTPLHLTVRSPRAAPTCQGSSRLAGNWPNNLTLAQGQDPTHCNVNLNNYIIRLNSLGQVPPGGTTACRAAFIAAIGSGLDPAIGQSYLNLCNTLGCP